MCDIRTLVFVRCSERQCTVLVLPLSIRRMCAMATLDVVETKVCHSDRGKGRLERIQPDLIRPPWPYCPWHGVAAPRRSTAAMRRRPCIPICACRRKSVCRREAVLRETSAYPLSGEQYGTASTKPVRPNPFQPMAGPGRLAAVASFHPGIRQHIRMGDDRKYLR